MTLAKSATLLSCCLLASLLVAQDTAPMSAIAARVQLDSVVISASRRGFDIEDFVALVRNDSSLYQAFHNLRTASYVFSTEMRFQDKRSETKASYASHNTQVSDGRCRYMKILDEHASGDFYKGRKQKIRYYTYDLYDRLFLTHDTVCITAGNNAEQEPTSTMERHVAELKKLIFRPGERSNVPFVGKKSEIFSEDMIDLYDLSITSAEYQGDSVYVFMARVKADYADKENKTLFKELTTYFNKRDFQVLGREYRLSQNTAAYMFDVRMHVDLINFDGKYFPAKVVYDGVWNIPTKKKEDGTFVITLSQFK